MAGTLLSGMANAVLNTAKAANDTYNASAAGSTQAEDTMSLWRTALSALGLIGICALCAVAIKYLPRAEKNEPRPDFGAPLYKV